MIFILISIIMFYKNMRLVNTILLLVFSLLISLFHKKYLKLFQLRKFSLIKNLLLLNFESNAIILLLISYIADIDERNKLVIVGIMIIDLLERFKIIEFRRDLKKLLSVSFYVFQIFYNLYLFKKSFMSFFINLLLLNSYVILKLIVR